MVKGLDKFKVYFANFSEQYVLIGGAACDISFDEIVRTSAQQKILMLYSLLKH